MKEYIVYFVVAYFWGMLLQVIVELFRGTGFADIFAKSNVSGLFLAGLIFAVLMTLFKYVESRMRARRKS